MNSSKRKINEEQKQKNLLRRTKRRKTLAQERRFNDPLVIFLERRHPQVLYEYKQLYKYLDNNNPNKKNLLKSDSFQDWLETNPIPTTPTLVVNGESTRPILAVQESALQESISTMQEDDFIKFLDELFDVVQESAPQEPIPTMPTVIVNGESTSTRPISVQESTLQEDEFNKLVDELCELHDTDYFSHNIIPFEPFDFSECEEC